MKLNYKQFRKKIGITFSLFFMVFFLAMISFTPWSCKEESISLQNNLEPTVKYRGGGEDQLSTADIIELLGESCVPGSINIGFGCNDVEYIDTVVVTLPTYTGCSFTIVYKHYECAAGGLLDYTMGDFQILSHNCSAFTSGLGSAFTAGGSTLTTFVENFELAIYNQLEQIIIAQYVPTGTYLCQHGLFFNIIFIKASCYKRCLMNFNDGSASYVKVACGADCCERHTRVCRDQNGDLYTEVEYVHPSDPYCEDPPDFSGNPVLSRCVRETSCAYKCPGQ